MYEAQTGNKIKLVNIITATPKLAVIASSRIIPISIVNKVKKPTVSDKRAIPPGIKSALKLD